MENFKILQPEVTTIPSSAELTKHQDLVRKARTLLSTNHFSRIEQSLQTAIQIIDKTDLATKFFQCLEKGFNAFEVVVDPFLARLSLAQRNQLFDHLELALKKCGLNLGSEEVLVSIFTDLSSGKLTLIVCPTLLKEIYPEYNRYQDKVTNYIVVEPFQNCP